MRNLALVFLLFFSANLWSAEAADTGFYAGGALGYAKLNDDGMGANQNFDDNSGTARIFGGYEFNSYLAAEASIDLLGSYEGKTTTAHIYNSYSEFALTLVGRIPLTAGLSLFAQGGGGVVSIHQVVDGTIGAFYYDDEDASSSGMATVFGGGLSYNIPRLKALEIRAGYLQTRFDVDAAAIDGLGNLVENNYNQKIKQFYLGAAYHF